MVAFKATDGVSAYRWRQTIICTISTFIHIFAMNAVASKPRFTFTLYSSIGHVTIRVRMANVSSTETFETALFILAGFSPVAYYLISVTFIEINALSSVNTDTLKSFFAITGVATGNISTDRVRVTNVLISAFVNIETRPGTWTIALPAHARIFPTCGIFRAVRAFETALTVS